MTSRTSAESRAHPIARFSSRLHEVLDGLAPTPAWSMSTEEQRQTLVEIARAEARLGELRLRVLAAADRSDVAAVSAATSTGAWVAQRTQVTRSQSQADVRLARALEDGFAATREALACGRVNVDQARVIVAAVEALPEAAGAGLREMAEKQLVHDAGEHDARALKTLGRRVFEVVDPAAAEAEEGRRLEAEEHAAERATWLRLFDNGDGTHTGRFKIPTLHAAMLTKMLHAFTAPRRPRTGSGVVGADGSRVSRPELLGRGLCELLERYPTDRLPEAGGVSATVLVLLDYDRLLTGLGAAQLDTGESISAGAARRLACDAGVVPVVYRTVLGGPSVALDVGRRRRLHGRSQRIALTVRDRGCTAENCDRPPGWCHAHHGKAHSPAYDMTRLPNGQVRFHRRE